MLRPGTTHVPSPENPRLAELICRAINSCGEYIHIGIQGFVIDDEECNDAHHRASLLNNKQVTDARSRCSRQLFRKTLSSPPPSSAREEPSRFRSDRSFASACMLPFRVLLIVLK